MKRTRRMDLVRRRKYEGDKEKNSECNRPEASSRKDDGGSDGGDGGDGGGRQELLSYYCTGGDDTALSQVIAEL
jgi:hypothetical protein